jgi:hypothetical protein
MRPAFFVENDELRENFPALAKMITSVPGTAAGGEG